MSKWELTDNVEDYFWQYEGKPMPHDELMIAKLLQAGVLSIDYAKDSGLTLMVNCNDLFAWACTDDQEIPNETALVDLFRLHMADPYGAEKWACKQRQQQPQGPVVKQMKEQGAWDAEMEAIPASRYEAAIASGKGWFEALNAMDEPKPTESEGEK